MEARINELTVMLYMVGTDLERKTFDETAALFEVMKGISGHLRSDALPDGPRVRFTAETGGCCFDPERSVTGGGEKGARFKRELAWAGHMNKLPTCLKKISWDVNERWEITADDVIPMKFRPKDGTRIMTQKDEDGCVSELLDFVEASVLQFPARQYILIICGHGGGPLWGFGEDERNDDEMILPSDICRTIPRILDITGKKLALTGYASCFISCPENLLAWSEGTRAFLSSETNSNMEAWIRREVIHTLLTCVDDRCESGPLTDEVFDEQILPALLKNVFDGHISADCGHILAAFLPDKEKIRAFERAYLEFTRPLIKRMFSSPLESFNALMQARRKSQKIDEYSIDLGSFLKQITVHPFFSDICDLDRLYAALIRSIGDMTLGIEQTSDFNGEASGLFLFLPVTASTTINSNWEKYLFSHRRSEKDGFKTWPFSGYDKPLPRPEDDKTGDFCNEFLSLKDGIWTLGGLFCAMREAGSLLTDPDSKTEDIAGKLRDELSVCGLKAAFDEGQIRDLSEEVIRRRDDGSFTEGIFTKVRVKCRYRKKRETFTRNRGMGYIPAGYAGHTEGFKWFYAQNDAGTSFLLPVYKISGSRGDTSYDSFFTQETQILTPVLFKGSMRMLRIVYEKGEDTGKVTGAAFFSFASASFKDAFDADIPDDGAKVFFLGSVAEGERYEMAFFDDRPRDFIVGTATFGKLTLKRGSIAGITLPDYYEDTEISCYVRDIFNAGTVIENRTFVCK